MVERWNYPDDGYGDCEDYVLLKREMLMPVRLAARGVVDYRCARQAREIGDAVLTVKTDKGEFILDNQSEEILLWSDTTYRFVKRQSQSDPNLWVASSPLVPPRPQQPPPAALTLPAEFFQARQDQRDVAVPRLTSADCRARDPEIGSLCDCRFTKR